MSQQITKKDLFKSNPTIDPRTGENIEINSIEYNQLVNKYGEPNKIKSPKSNKLISIGKGEYKKLKTEGYTDEQLLTQYKINKKEQIIPQLPVDVMPYITSNLPLTNKRLINKAYNKEAQLDFEKENKQGIINFIFNETYEDDWEDMNEWKMEESGIQSFKSADEFKNYQIEQINKLSLDDILFYKRLINMIKRKQIISVDEENYGYHKATSFQFVHEGIFLHQ